MNCLQIPAIAAVCLIAVGTHAQSSIAINFSTNATAGVGMLVPTDVAGYPPVEQANWNNMTISNGDGNGRNNNGSLTNNVVDSAGALVPAFSIVVAATSTTQVWRISLADWGFTGNNLKLQRGGVYPEPKITALNVPYSHYDVYVYSGCGGTSADGGVKISVLSGATGEVAADNKYYHRYKWHTNRFVLSTYLTLAEAQASDGSHIAVFRNNTARSFVVDCSGKEGTGWLSYTGIQIVQVPPPPPARTLLMIR